MWTHSRLKLAGLSILSAICFLQMPSAFAHGSEQSIATSAQLSIVAGSVVVTGSALLATEGGQFVVESVENVGNSVVYGVQKVGGDASAASKASIQLGANASGHGSLAVGQSVQAVAESTGTAIIASGKLIAFIPNELGKSLVHHAQIK